MCNKGIENYPMSHSNYWNRDASDYSTEIKQRTRSSVLCRMYVTSTKTSQTFILISVSSNQVQKEMCRLWHIFMYDPVGNSTERIEWLISHNKLEVVGRKLHVHVSIAIFSCRDWKNVWKPWKRTVGFQAESRPGNVRNRSQNCQISGFRHGAVKVSVLLGGCAASVGSSITDFSGQIRCPETSVTYYQSALRNVLEQQRPRFGSVYHVSQTAE